jgi:hypothetical protein
MGHDYNNMDIMINQNYLDSDNLSNNVYNWNTICCFIHHNILDHSVYTLIKKRCDRFNNIITAYNESTALFHITKIISCENITEYMNNILELKKRNNITCIIIMIINCCNVEDSEYYNALDKCLFIIKKVEDYDTQYAKYKIDNDLNYTREFNIIKKYFTLRLMENK